MQKKKWTRDEVAKHNTKEDFYTIVHNKVYDMTHYVDKHPGGYDLLFKNAGKDSTADFEAMYHSLKARNLLEEYYVGDLEDPMSVTSGNNNMLTRFANQNRLTVYNTGNTSGGNGNAKYPFLNNRRNQQVPATHTFKIPTSTNTTTTSTTATATEPMSDIKFKRYKLVQRIDLTNDTAIFKFRLPKAFRQSNLSLLPGKHIQICVLSEDANTLKVTRIVRKYTPIHTDEPGFFELLVKKYDNGFVSSHIHNLKVGERLLMRGPFGVYDHQLHKNKKILMLAIGTGIAPMYQIIRGSLLQHHDTELFLLYGNRTQQDILLKKELDKLATDHKDLFSMQYMLSQSTTETTHDNNLYLKGRIHIDAVQQFLSSRGTNIEQIEQILLCGTDEFCEKVRQACIDSLSVPATKIHIF
jgi:NAD(P)H-flavin reductase